MKNTRSNTMDMTEGKSLPLILAFALPMLLGNIFQQLYNLADSVIVGKLVGADALAAIGATSSITFFFFALCNGIGSAGGIIASQLYGGKNYKMVKKCISNTAYIMIIFPAIVGTVAFITSKPLLEFLDTPKNVLPDSLAYVHIMCVGIIFVSLYNFISSMLRAFGDSKSPLYFLIFSCVVNVGLDILFVYAFKLGVRGAGYATIISQFLAGFGALIYATKKNEFFKLEKDDLSPHFELIKRTISLGIPLSLQFSLIAVSCMALQKVVNGFGAVAMAAFAATSRIEQLIHQPYQTLSAALSTFTGQNYGAKKPERMSDGYKKSFMIMVIFSLVMWPVMTVFGHQVIKLFVNEPEVIEMGAKALTITSIFYVCLGAIYVIRGVLNGMGDGFFALLNGIVEVIGRFTVPFILTAIPFIGLWGIWWSVGVVWFLSGFTAWLRYVYYKKKKLSHIFE